MFRIILRTICLITTVIVFTAGCSEITSLIQPSTVDDGEQFEITVEATYDEGSVYDTNSYVVLYIMLPESFTVDGGVCSLSIEGVPIGECTMIDDDWWEGEPFYEYYPLPPNYVWSGWRSSESYPTGGDNTIHEIIYEFDITAHSLKDEDYFISYVAASYRQDAGEVIFFGMAANQSWDNPITVTTGSSIKSVSLGELKANFR